MEIKDKIYFTRMSKYSPRQEYYSEKNLTLVRDFAEMINKVAKEALLNEDVSPNITRREISDLLENIKQLKKEGVDDVRKH